MRITVIAALTLALGAAPAHGAQTTVVCEGAGWYRPPGAAACIPVGAVPCGAGYCENGFSCRTPNPPTCDAPPDYVFGPTCPGAALPCPYGDSCQGSLCYDPQLIFFCPDGTSRHVGAKC